MRQWIVLGLLLLLPVRSEAARKVNGTQPVLIRLEMHYMAVLSFPEEIDYVMGAGRGETTPAGGGQPGLPSGLAAAQPITYEVYNNVMGLALVQPDAVGRILVFG